jgi:hypothetical protein
MRERNIHLCEKTRLNILTRQVLDAFSQIVAEVAEARTKREIKFPLIASILAEDVRQPDHWTVIGNQSLDDIDSPLLTWLQKTAASRRTL